ncbi:MAG: helix-turn-helix transcriptional regulator [Pseudomonadota bacterium]
MTQDAKTLLGKKIKQLRNITNTTQVDLMKAVGYTSTGMVSQIESGERGMTLEKITLAAKFFGVPESFLMNTQEYSDDDLALLRKFTQIVEAPADKKPPYYEAIRTLILGS